MRLFAKNCFGVQTKEIESTTNFNFFGVCPAEKLIFVGFYYLCMWKDKF